MSALYDQYLITHIGNVKRGYHWLCEQFPDILEKMGSHGQVIEQHDQSKYGDEEYHAYDAYFYGKNKSYQVKQDFNYAWLHHIHHNPHHWQYWVLQHDDEPEEALEMPYWYVIEMICDWWAFSWASEKLDEIFDWYEKHKDMKLHEKTRKLVDETLERMKEKLRETTDSENKENL